MIKIKEGSKIGSLFFIQIPLILICFILVYNVQVPEHKPTKTISMSAPAEVVQHTVLGFNLLAADLIWLRLIQDIDFKEVDRPNMGWAYHMLDAVTTLDHRYKMAYLLGLYSLSVLIRDKEGGRLLYERAAKNFPDNWQILYAAGYHNLYEVGDCARAAYFLKEAAYHGAPAWAATLSIRLYTSAGQKELGIQVIKEALDKFKGTPQEDFFKGRLEELLKKGQTSVSSEIICKKPAS